MLTKEHVTKLEGAIASKDLNPNSVYQKYALHEVIDSHFGVERQILLGLGFGIVSFAFMGLPGLAAIGLMTFGGVRKKWAKGVRAIAEIEDGGDFTEYLPEDKKRQYVRLKSSTLPTETNPQPEKAIAVEVVEVADIPAPATTPIAGTPPAATPQPENSIAVDLDSESVGVEPVATVASEEVVALPEVKRVQTVTVDTAVNCQVANVAAMVSAKLRSILFTANPRHGKGIVVAHSWRLLKGQYPGLTVWVIDPKNHPSESGYYEGVDRYWGRRLEQYPQDDAEVAKELDQFILEWRNQPTRPTLLIMDELVLLKALQPTWYRKTATPTIAAEASTGETDQRFIHGITQSPQIGDIGMTGGSRSCLHLVAIESNESQAHFDAIQKSYNNGLPEMPSDRTLANSPRGKCAYVSWMREWYLIPNMAVPAPTEYAHRQPESSGGVELDRSVELVPGEANEYADKLLAWLSGTGLKYADVDGWIPLATILQKWRVKRDGKTVAPSHVELGAWLKELGIRKAILASREKGIKAK